MTVRKRPGRDPDRATQTGEKNRDMGQRPPPEAGLDEISLDFDTAAAGQPPPARQQQPGKTEKKTPAIYDADGDPEPFDQPDAY